MQAIVCDNGSASLKCGYAGSSSPDLVIPTVLGRPQHPILDSAGSEEQEQPFVIGSACFGQRQNLRKSQLIVNGVIQKWEDMGHLWDFAFQELGINPGECHLLLPEPPLNPPKNRELMVETMFEKYGFHSLYLQHQAVLPLYAQGNETGLVLDCGENSIHAVPVVEGCIYSHAAKRMSVGGRHLTAHLINLLLQRGYLINKSADTELLQYVKEKYCYMSTDLQREVQLAEETTVLVKKFTLPDGRSIKVDSERFQTPEALFRPELVDKGDMGITDVVFKAVQDSDIDHRLRLLENITLCGGSSMFPGLPGRLDKELREQYLTHVLKGNKDGLKKLKLKVDDKASRKYYVFEGGAVLADIMKDNPNFWTSRADYFERGTYATNAS